MDEPVTQTEGHALPPGAGHELDTNSTIQMAVVQQDLTSQLPLEETEPDLGQKVMEGQNEDSMETNLVMQTEEDVVMTVQQQKDGLIVVHQGQVLEEGEGQNSGEIVTSQEAVTIDEEVLTEKIGENIPVKTEDQTEMVSCTPTMPNSGSTSTSTGPAMTTATTRRRTDLSLAEKKSILLNYDGLPKMSQRQAAKLLNIAQSTLAHIVKNR